MNGCIMLKIQIGDVIKIKGISSCFLVVRSQRQVSEDLFRNESYWVDEIGVIRAAVNTKTSKVRNFYFKEGCMHGKGAGISESDVTIVGTGRFRTIPSVYEVTKVKT